MKLATELKSACDELLLNNKLREIDLQLARQIVNYESHPVSELSSEQTDALFLACVILSASLAKGQVCLPLNRCNIPELAVFWPGEAGLLDALTSSVCVYVATDVSNNSVGSDKAEKSWQSQPLVLDLNFATPRLYLARYYFYEQGVHHNIQQRLSGGNLTADDENQLRQQLLALFPDSASDNNQQDWQLVAAATACLQRFSVITGGPGTGKTTTVTKLLSAMLSLNPDMHIALAAPTGKAAARMTESIRGAKLRAQSDGSLSNAQLIPDDSHTLHRLLGWTPNGFRYNSKHPLPYDCVVVDEASMIDLPMMHHLMTALPTQARLILLGDRDQLASVEVGSVLADLCDAGNEHGPSSQFAELLQSLTQQNLERYVENRTELGSDDSQDTGIDDQQGADIQNALAQLRVSHRFDADSGIGQLAAAVNQGNQGCALSVFNNFSDIDLIWHNEPARNTGRAARQKTEAWQRLMVRGYQSYCAAVAGGDIKSILNAFNDFQILSATRSGQYGVEELNRMIERLLRPRLDALQRYSGVMYPGRAVMISRNDYDLGLFNGDIGVVVEVTDDSGSSQLKVAFMNPDGDVRLLLPSRLPDHETAFAMTVHKSQGSEFTEVFLVLPLQWQGVITRELIYTAITRAKKHFTLLTSMHSWQTGIMTRVERASGLRDKLWH